MTKKQARAPRMRSNWTRLPAIEGGQPSSCRCCGPRKSQLCADSVIAVGFGFAGLTKNGEVVWDENGQDVRGWDDLMTVGEAEELAAAEPDNDWQIVMNGPLRGSTYQRQGEMKWVLVETNEGFA